MTADVEQDRRRPQATTNSLQAARISLPTPTHELRTPLDGNGADLDTLRIHDLPDDEGAEVGPDLRARSAG